ncbi:hypothetical protein JAAARDRAFT_29893 [Jaapia argillacea MUCL 33604]|uniref:Uncharacterized protein n=1 Tax=Jaapia argillacea MUCL 33604 TaxID=933084 RepID=A0A067QMI8_9AGAM|nr:hypothetical protein JAAARDRAFT_29893 [Jaapia argillacea MUCL 33604]
MAAIPSWVTRCTFAQIRLEETPMDLTSTIKVDQWDLSRVILANLRTLGWVSEAKGTIVCTGRYQWRNA